MIIIFLTSTSAFAFPGYRVIQAHVTKGPGYSRSRSQVCAGLAILTTESFANHLLPKVLLKYVTFQNDSFSCAPPPHSSVLLLARFNKKSPQTATLLPYPGIFSAFSVFEVYTLFSSAQAQVCQQGLIEILNNFWCKAWVFKHIGLISWKLWK